MSRSSVVLIAAVLLGFLGALLALRASGVLIGIFLLVLSLLALAGLTLVALTMRRRRPHPAMVSWSEVEIDVATAREMLENRQPLMLRFGGRPVALHLERVEVLDPAYEVRIVGGEGPRSVPAVDTASYAGRALRLDGEEGNAVLTLGPGEVFGMARVGSENWFLEPMRIYRRDAAKSTHVTYDTNRIRYKTSLRGDTVRGRGQPSPPESHPPVLADTSGAPVDDAFFHTLPIVLLADKELIEWLSLLSIDLQTYHQSLLTLMAEETYRRQIGFRFRLLQSYVDADNTFFKSTNSNTLLGQVGTEAPKLVDAANLNEGPLIHLTSGKNFAGTVIGLAEQPGSNSVTQHTSFGLTHRDYNVMSHEIGHNLSADHQYAQEWCHTHVGPVCTDKRRNLMWQTYYGDNTDYFDPTNRQNVLAMWKQRQRIRYGGSWSDFQMLPSGTTKNTPVFASDGSRLCMLVCSETSDAIYANLSLDGSSWGGFTKLSSGATANTPALVFFGGSS